MAKKSTVEAIATVSPVAAVPPGGFWEPPEGNKDVAVLVPYGYKGMTDMVAKTGLVVHSFDGLDGAYILSSDGSTRPAEATQ